MVFLSAVQSSNSHIVSSLPPRLVAVFVGATKGIGATTLKQFAKHACQPRAYFIGRSQDAGDRITAECKALNPEGEYIFVKADASLIRVVDDVCQEIRKKEKAINILFLSAGTLALHTGMSTFPGGRSAGKVCERGGKCLHHAHEISSVALPAPQAFPIWSCLCDGGRRW